MKYWEVKRRYPGAFAHECPDGFIDIIAPHYYGRDDPAVLAWAETEAEAWERASDPVLDAITEMARLRQTIKVDQNTTEE